MKSSPLTNAHLGKLSELIAGRASDVKAADALPDGHPDKDAQLVNSSPTSTLGFQFKDDSGTLRKVGIILQPTP